MSNSNIRWFIQVKTQQNLTNGRGQFFLGFEDAFAKLGDSSDAVQFESNCHAMTFLTSSKLLELVRGDVISVHIVSMQPATWRRVRG